MPVISHDRLSRALAEGRRGGVFFLYGDETFLKEQALRELIAAHLDPSTRDFNLDQLRGDEVAADTLASILATPPMMAEWRVVVVRDAQGLAGSPRTRSAVEEMLDRSVPGLVLVLVADIPSRSRAKFYRTLKDQAVAVEFARMDANDVPGWVMGRARGDGFEVDADAARMLAAAVGPDLGVVVRELAKLRDFVGERARVTTEDVQAAVGRIPRQNRWAWFDLVGERRFAEARSTLPVLLDSRESGVGLVIGLGSHMLRLAIAAEGGQRALGSALPPHQRWLAKRVAAQARGWTGAALGAALEDLLRADRLLKSASLDDRQVLDELLLRLQARSAEVAA